MRQLLIKCILFFYLFASFAGAGHIHSDHEEAHECKICIVLHAIHLGDQPEHSAFDFSCDWLREEIVLDARLHRYFPCKGFFSTAPPLALI